MTEFHEGQRVVLDRTLYVTIDKPLKKPGSDRFTEAIIRAGGGTTVVGLEHLGLEREEIDS